MSRSTVAHSLILAAGLALALPSTAEARGGGGGGMGGFHGGGIGGFRLGGIGGFHFRGGGTALAPRVAGPPRIARAFRHAAIPHTGVLPLRGLAYGWGYYGSGVPLFLDTPIPPLVSTPVPPLSGTTVPLVVQPTVQPHPGPEVWRRDGDVWRLASGPH